MPLNIEVNGGTATIEHCSFNGANASVEIGRFAAKHLLVARSTGRLRLSDSSVVVAEKSDSSDGLLRLLDNAHALIRGCQVIGAAISPDVPEDRINLGTLGIVNSTFIPPLSVSVTTVGPPRCFAMVAGTTPMCDARALCEHVPGCGVKCSCEGDGLRYKPGVPADGRQCEQDAKLVAALQTSVVSIAIKKLGVGRDTLRVIMQAIGEGSYNFGLSVNVGRLDGVRHRREYWSQLSLGSRLTSLPFRRLGSTSNGTITTRLSTGSPT